MLSVGGVDCKPIDVFEDCHLSLSACILGPATDQFGLDSFEEGFDCCVVMTIALAAHRYIEAMLAQDIPVIV